MERYLIKGLSNLQGEVTISGAKNAAVAIIPATILARGRCIIENVPNISDTAALFKILESLGASVKMLDRNTVEIDTSDIGEPVVPHDLARMLRASYYFLGALLGSCRRASVSMPGGCDFGVRPIDQHIKGFEAFGTNVSVDYGMINVSAERLTGAHIYFDVVSVGATINVMLAAVRAKGVTVLENVAKEPHIVDLANFLNSMGADVRGAGTDVIKIHGVDIMHGSTYSIIPDQIEAGTYMVAAAATGGDVLVKNVIPKHLESIIEKLERTGAEITEYDDSVRIIRKKPIEPVNIKTMPHPGFPTDMQAQMTAMLMMSTGTSIITEGVWDNRFRYVDELLRMGANIKVDGKVAVVQGVQELTAAPLKATDLRGGAAMIIAALMAKGDTQISDIYHIERGYENILEKFRGLGAQIEKISEPDPVSAQSA